MPWDFIAFFTAGVWTGFATGYFTGQMRGYLSGQNDRLAEEAKEKKFAAEQEQAAKMRAAKIDHDSPNHICTNFCPVNQDFKWSDPWGRRV